MCVRVGALFMCTWACVSLRICWSVCACGCVGAYLCARRWLCVCLCLSGLLSASMGMLVCTRVHHMRVSINIGCVWFCVRACVGVRVVAQLVMLCHMGDFECLS